MSNSIDNRRDKVNYYLDIAETVAERSTCLKRRYGSVIVKNNSIVSMGYNGSPRGMLSCIDTKKCNRESSQRGTDYSYCPAVHSEVNAILQAGRERTLGADLYLVGYELTENPTKYVKNSSSCTNCRRIIINAGIERVFIRINEMNYKEVNVKREWANDLNNILGGY